MNEIMLNRQAMQELKSLLFERFPGEIEKAILFGSRVKGEARQFSDYDVLVIVNHDYDWRFENRVYDTAYDIDVKHDLFVDMKIISTAEMQTMKGKQPFIRNALKHGVEL